MIVPLLLAPAGCSTSSLSAASAPVTAPVQPSTTASASTTVAASDAGDLVIDPSWVSQDPRLTDVIRAAGPACTSREHFFKNYDATRAHAYQVWAPSLAQSDLEQRFRAAAKDLGYAVKPDPAGGVAFRDEARQVSSNAREAFVTVIVGRSGDPRESVAKLAAQARVETWGLVDALGESETWEITFDRVRGTGTTFTAQLIIPEAKRAAIDAWARERKLERIDRAWIRKFRPETPEVSGISIDLQGAKLTVSETRAPGPRGPTPSACREHPSRQAPEQPDAAQPKETDDELIRQMMGQ